FARLQYGAVAVFDALGACRVGERPYRAAEYAVRADVMDRAEGRVDRDIGKVPVLDDHRRRQGFEDFLRQRDALQIRAPLPFLLLVLGDVDERRHIVAVRQAALAEVDPAVTAEPFDGFVLLSPMGGNAG